jgi:hypothetical protein
MAEAPARPRSCAQRATSPATTLTIRDEDDKNRLGCAFPLTHVPALRAALDGVCPAEGPIFGAHDYRHILRKAAKAAGIDDLRARRISDCDFGTRG